MKTLRVELTQEEEDGRRFVKTLEGEDAQQWQQWVNSVCLLAWTHRHNPPWEKLHWHTEEITAPAAEPGKA